MSTVLLPAASRLAQPWKNNGGITREVACCPAGAGFDFDWRISLAEVTTSGPFSIFPGMERSLTVLTGSMMLHLQAREPVELTQDSAPYAFPGDIPCTATLNSPVTDLNVMTRRDRFTAQIARASGHGMMRVKMPTDSAFLVVTAGEIETTSHHLRCYDALQIEGAQNLPIMAQHATIYVIGFTPG